MAAIGGYPLDPQQESEWCWAAVAQSVARYVDPQSKITQCAIANKVAAKKGASKNKPNCCTTADSSTCNCPQKLTDALDTLGEKTVSPLRIINRPLSFQELKQELDAELPVCIRIAWEGGGAHFVVITGYGRLTSGAQHVDVADPLYPDCTIDYEELRNAYHGDGQWTHSYLLKGY